MDLNLLAKWRNVFDLPFKEDADTSLFEKICIVLLALCPILQHYKGFFQDASTIVMIAVFPYFGLKLLRAKKWNFSAVLALMVFSLYETVNHGIGLMELGRELLLMAYFLAAANKVIDLKYFIKTAIIIALTASVLMIVQYFCYYVLGFHLQLVVTSLLDESAAQWVQLAQTGTISVSGNPTNFYRPSAFFLEPSHLTIYCFPALALVLLSPKVNRSRIVLSALISLGIVLSTSGMGIALVGGLWMLFILQRFMGEGDFRKKMKQLFSPTNLKWFAVIIVGFLVLYAAIPPFRMSINRIFVSGTSGKSAIEGRMGTGIKALQALSGGEFWFGRSNWGNVHNWNMSGLFYTFYTQGFLGMLLSYGFYAQSLLKTKAPFFWISLLLIGLSLVTVHTHAAFYMMFYVLILLQGYSPKRNDKFVLRNRLRRIVLRIETRCRELLPKPKEKSPTQKEQA